VLTRDDLWERARLGGGRTVYLFEDEVPDLDRLARPAQDDPARTIEIMTQSGLPPCLRVLPEGSEDSWIHVRVLPRARPPV
jgi:hypothetical protein